MLSRRPRVAGSATVRSVELLGGRLLHVRLLGGRRPGGRLLGFGLLVVGLLAVGLLSGCTPGAPVPTHTPTATPTPVFASDADALKAATDAYAAYLKMSDTIAHDGGKAPERIKPFVTAAWYSKEAKVFAAFRSSGLTQTGWTEFRSQRLQNYDKGDPEIVMYVCVDAAGTAIVDSGGKNVTPESRPAIVPSVATFVVLGSNVTHRLRLENYEPWPGRSFC